MGTMNAIVTLALLLSSPLTDPAGVVKKIKEVDVGRANIAEAEMTETRSLPPGNPHGMTSLSTRTLPERSGVGTGIHRMSCAVTALMIAISAPDLQGLRTTPTPNELFSVNYEHTNTVHK